MKKRSFSTLCFILSVVSAICGETAFFYLPDLVWIRIVCKIVTAVAILSYAVCCRDRKKQGLSWIFAALFFSVLGDVVISIVFLPGMISFALGHICLILLFCRRRSLSRKLWIIWGIVSVVLAALILILGHNMGIYAYEAAVYAPIILLMVFVAVRQQGAMRIGALLYFGSDVLLALYQWKQIHPLVHVLYMGMFYLALLLYAGGRENN